MDRRDKMASGSSINSFKRKLDDLESSSLPSDAKEQLRMVFKLVTGIYDDAPVEQHKELLAQFESFTRRAKGKLARSRSKAPDGERSAKRLKTTNRESDERDGRALPSVNWGTVVCLGLVMAPLSNELTAERLNDIMRQFRDQLVELGEVETMCGTMIGRYQWMPADATDLANHIFVEMLGGMCYCLRSSVGRTGPTIKLSDYAMEFQFLNNMPPLVATFFNHLGNVRDSFKSFKNMAFWHLGRDWHQYKLFQTYEELKRRFDEDDEQIVTYLRAHIKASPRGTWDTSVVDIFLTEWLQFLNWSKADRARVYSQGNVLVDLVEVFGEGALGFLGYNSAKQLGEFEGKLHLKHAWELLDRLCPELRELANLIEERILQPLKEGTEIAEGDHRGSTAEDMLKNIQGWRVPLKLRTTRG